MPIVKRDTNWQALRGKCIIAVVLIHCEHYVQWDGSVREYEKKSVKISKEGLL